MNIKKNIFIQHACMYTRDGIEFVLDDLRNSGLDINVTAGVATLDMVAYQALYNSHTDIFILGLQGNSGNYGNLLNFIIEWLPIHYPQAKVIVMANTQSIGRLKDYLLGLSNIVAVLDNSIELQDLQLHLQNIIAEKQHIKYEEKKAVPLTHQEINVLGRLLKGIPVIKIADALDINYKTVSSHKRSAMNKLGVTSLHSLMTCEINIAMIARLFSTKAQGKTYQ